MKRYPRVLFVTKSQIGDIDSAGAAVRGWFKEWSREDLAQVFSGVPAGGKTFCGRSFQLRAQERRFGELFFRLKSSGLGESAMPYRDAARGPSGGGLGGLLGRWRRALGRTLVESGLWELVFPPRLSPGLEEFILAFKPDVMFVQGCDLSFMRLPLMIRERFGTPIHFDVVDDWVAHLYRKSIAGPIVTRVLQATFRRLAFASVGRHAIGDAMAEEYRRRYGLTFSTLMQCDDQERFVTPRVPEGAREREFRVVYSGSLALNRWKGLLDLAHACATLSTTERPISITAYAPFVPPEAIDKLRAAPSLIVTAAVPDEEVPGILTSADLLFLPESFDPEISSYIRLSVSTKAHLYMMSRRPSLVYGPSGIGTVEYARKEGWAFVVDREGAGPLAEAVQRLLESKRLCDAIVRRASEVADSNHSGPVVRDRLRQALLSSIS